MKKKIKEKIIDAGPFGFMKLDSKKINSDFHKEKAKIFGTFGDAKKDFFGNTIIIKY